MTDRRKYLVANDDATETAVQVGECYRVEYHPGRGVVFVPVPVSDAESAARIRARQYAEALIEIRRVVRQFGEL